MARALRSTAVALNVLAALALPAPGMAQECAGDCDSDSVVGVNELVLCMNIALGDGRVGDCDSCDSSQDGEVTVEELVAAVGSALGFSLQGVCRVPCQGAECEMPQATANGLVPCGAGTVVKVSRCTDRATCLREETGRTEPDVGLVESSGEFTVGIDACRRAGGLFLVEADLDGGTYRTLVSLAAGAAAGTTVAGDLALAGDVLLDPSSEAAVRLLDSLGLERFTDEGVADVIAAVGSANGDTQYADQSPSAAAGHAGEVAGEDQRVQDAVMSGKASTPTASPTHTSSFPSATPTATAQITGTVVVTSTPATPTRTPPSGRVEIEIGSASTAPDRHVTIGVTLNVPLDAQVIGTLNDIGFVPDARIVERHGPVGVLRHSVSATDTAIVLGDASILPPFGIVQIDDEMIAYGEIRDTVLVVGGCLGGDDAGNTCVDNTDCSGGGTCQPIGRGQEGTIPSAHPAGAEIHSHRMPDCRMSHELETLGKSAVFSFLPLGCTPQVDCDTVRAIVIALDNLNVLPSGETLLYTCGLDAGSVEGTFPLTCENVQASGSPDGAGLLPASCIEGGITILEGLPTETPTPTFTPTQTPATPTVTPPDGSSVTIDVGSAFGRPGETVRVDVTLQVFNAQVAGTDNRIEVSPGTRILGCEIAPVFDSFSQVMLQPNGCDEDPNVDCNAARGLVLESSLMPIENGAMLYSCEIEILPGTAPGIFPIVCSNQLASSPSGQRYDGMGRCEQHGSTSCGTDADCAAFGGACHHLPPTQCNSGSIMVSDGTPLTPTPTEGSPTLPPTPTPTPTSTGTPDSALEIRIGSTALAPNGSGTFDVMLHVGAGHQATGVLHDILLPDGVTIPARMTTAAFLSADVGPDDTAIAVDDASTLPEFGFVQIDEELIAYERLDGTVLAAGSCSSGGGFCADDADCDPGGVCHPTGRGQDGTEPVSHTAGTSVEAPTRVPECVMSPELNTLDKDAVFSFLPDDCIPGFDCRSIRAIIINLSDLSPFPGGDTVLYSCAVQASEDEGTFPLECADAQVSGLPGQGLLDATCAGGQVFVQTSICGNGTVEGSEQCDDRGSCVGGPNELADCTSPGDCPKGACRPAGGDGCAINCTSERVRRAVLGMGSQAVVQLATFPISVALSGSIGLTTGGRVETNVMGPQGEILARSAVYPIVIRLDDMVFDPVRITGLVCGCPRPVEAPTFGAGNSATGAIACAADGILDISYKLTLDHVTNPGSPMNGNTEPRIGLQLPDDAECDDTFALPNGERSEACLEGTDENCSNPLARGQHPGTCNSPRTANFFGGYAGTGAALIQSRIAFGLLNDAGLCRTDLSPGDPRCPNAYGPDCQPCTEDDADLGAAETVFATTAWASAAVFDAAFERGRTLDVVDLPISCATTADCEPGQRCLRQCEMSGAACMDDIDCGSGDTCAPPRCSWTGCGSGSYISRCRTTAHGKPFDCGALAADETPDDGDGDGLSGGTLAVAFPSVDSLRLGDTVTTFVLELE